jgi:hypothetical protein
VARRQAITPGSKAANPLQARVDTGLRRHRGAMPAGSRALSSPGPLFHSGAVAERRLPALRPQSATVRLPLISNTERRSVVLFLPFLIRLFGGRCFVFPPLFQGFLQLLLMPCSVLEEKILYSLKLGFFQSLSRAVVDDGAELSHLAAYPRDVEGNIISIRFVRHPISQRRTDVPHKFTAGLFATAS